jgi:hypothetical protein
MAASIRGPAAQGLVRVFGLPARRRCCGRRARLAGLSRQLSLGRDDHERAENTTGKCACNRGRRARFTWVIGGSQSERRFRSSRSTTHLPALTQYLWGEDVATAWGADLLPNGDDYINRTTGRNRQYALFANATYAITDE